VDVEPAVTVVVEQGDAPGHGLGQLALRALAVVEGEMETGPLGVVKELEGRWSGSTAGRGDSGSRPIIGAHHRAAGRAEIGQAVGDRRTRVRSVGTIRRIRRR